MTERLCLDVILGRTGRVCEGCRRHVWTDKAHRLARSQGGPWRPDNVLGLCALCHRWAHANPHAAQRAGWIVQPGADPAQVPAFLVSASVWPGWYLLGVDGCHRPADPAPVPPLPPHFPRALVPAPPMPVEWA